MSIKIQNLDWMTSWPSGLISSFDQVFPVWFVIYRPGIRFHEPAGPAKPAGQLATTQMLAVHQLLITEHVLTKVHMLISLQILATVYSYRQTGHADWPCRLAMQTGHADRPSSINSAGQLT